VDKALAGESVLITRRGKPVAEIVPVRKTKKPFMLADLRTMTEGEAVYGGNDDDFIR
jgi:prevent-host-death family protein